MGLFKPKKSNKKKVVASVVGGAVAAGVAYLATTKKGKALVKDAKGGVTSMIRSAKKEEKILEKKLIKSIGKARTAVTKAKQAATKASGAAAKKPAVKRTVRAVAAKRKK
ncbi:MAG: hypothetical protein ABI778_10860 [Ignavibacteriota bacterium]